MKIMHSPVNFKANIMPKSQAQHITNTLKKAKNIDIVCHESTDRDSANSAIAIYDYLNSIGISSRIIASKNIQSLGLNAQNRNVIDSEKLNNDLKADTILCVDFSKSDRVSKDVFNRIKSAKNVLCIDHHKDFNLTDGNYTYIKNPTKQDENIQSATDFYIDISAKSTTSIIYRFFEALKEDIDNQTAFNLFTGLCDDAIKRGLITCDGQKGEINATEKLKEDKNALEIFENLKDKLSQEDISKIAKNIDIFTSLTEDELDFKNSLYEKLKLSKNKTIAYVEISPNDKMWEKVGGDNPTTSTILNRFRQSVLKNEFQDEKLKDVKCAITFYEADGKYRLSAHSKDNNLLEYFKYIEQEKIPNFTQNAGGHKSRAGGKIYSTNEEECHQWVNNIISCDNFFKY